MSSMDASSIAKVREDPIFCAIQLASYPSTSVRSLVPVPLYKDRIWDLGWARNAFSKWQTLSELRRGQRDDSSRGWALKFPRWRLMGSWPKERFTVFTCINDYSELLVDMASTGHTTQSINSTMMTRETRTFAELTIFSSSCLFQNTVITVISATDHSPRFSQQHTQASITGLPVHAAHFEKGTAFFKSCRRGEAGKYSVTGKACF